MTGDGRRITAVLACHGRAAVTLEGLAALFAQALPADLTLDAVVVDDGSPDGTAAAVAGRFPQVRLLHGDGRLWWAGAMARGLDEAARQAPDFLLWLNDDVRLDGGAVAALIACHDSWRTASGAAPALGPVVVGAIRDPGSGRLSYGGQRRDPRRPFRFHPVEPSDTAQPCDTFQGNAVLVPLAVHRRLGGIGAAFTGVQGMADTDFGLRAGQAGVPVVQAPGTVGTCAPNLAAPPWSDGARPLRARLAALAGPRGFPPRGWLAFARRHGGPAWPLWAAFPYLRRAWVALTAVPPAPAKPRVALMDGIMTHYRLPFLRQLAQADGWAITVFHGPAPAGHGAVMTDEPLPLPVLPVRHRAWPGGRKIAWTGGVLAALRGGYDAVIAAGHVHDLGVWTLWLARRLLGRPRLVLSAHFRLEGEGSGPAAALRGRLRAVLARGADAVLPYTPRFAAQCVAHGVPADRVFVTHNTVDVAAIRAAGAAVTPEAVAQARRRHALPDGPVFLFIGRLYAGKRVDLAIEAVADLRRRGRACALLVVGDGPDRPRIEALAAGEPGVRLTPALFGEEQLAPLFRLATAVVCPDSVGLLIAHAFAYGVPLVACRGAPGHGVEIDYLRHGENGLFADSLDAGALAAALEGLLDDPERLDQLRDGARRTADGLTIETIAAANLAALRRALGMDAAPDPGGTAS